MRVTTIKALSKRWG